MNDLEIRLEAEYESALDVEAPPIGVDVELARANGRALRRRRRVAGGVAGTGLLAAALSILIALGALPGVGRGSVDTTSGGGNYSGESVPPADDPLATRVSFGWLPDGVAVAGLMTQYPDIGDITAGGAGMRFTASVLPRGRQWAANCPTNQPAQSTPVPSASEVTLDSVTVQCDPPAANVNGRTAYWLTPPGNPEASYGGVALRWQYADDAWAELDAAVPATVDTPTVTDLMHRIAESIQVSRFQAVPMPFHVGKMPGGWQFALAGRIDGPQGRQVGADSSDWYGASLAINVGTSGPGSGEIQIWANPESATFPTATEKQAIVLSTPPSHTQNLTVDGHQAEILTDGNDTALIVHDVKGLDVVVEAIGAAGFSLVNSVGSIVDYYHTITFLGADRANWTTHVIG